jgi:hypothetical protein
MLEMWLLLQLRESSLREDMLLQDDAAPADFICGIYFSLFLRVAIRFYWILNMIRFMNK